MMNKVLLLQVRDKIVLQPWELNMTVFKPGCGTACCIAGHTLLLSSPGFYERVSSYHIFQPAAEALGLNDIQGQRLFYVDIWPKEFSEPYLALCVKNENGTEAWKPLSGKEAEAAKICADRINHFIKTEGQE